MSKKALAVDDSPVDLSNIKTILTDAGCVVSTATNGKEAIAKAKAEKPEVIISRWRAAVRHLLPS